MLQKSLNAILNQACVCVLFFCILFFFRLSSQFYRPGRAWWDRAVYVSQMQKETEVHQKILDSETTKGLYKHEKQERDSMSEEKRAPTTADQHLSLP